MSADLLARLEAVTARLERAASRMGGGGGGGGDDDDDLPPFVTEFQTIVNTNMPKVEKACKDLGLDTAGDILKRAYANAVDLVSRVPKAKKPSPQELTAFLKPAIDAIGEADTLKFKGKNFKKFGDHYKAVYEAVTSVSWVTMAPPMGTPATHVTSQKDATDFNLLKIKKNQKDDKNKAFVKSLEDLNKAMAEYAKQYFKKDGLVYNPKGGALSDVAGGAGAAKAAPAEEAKEASPAKAAGKKAAAAGGAAGGMGAVFGQLNKGLKVTGGLKKVTADQKTKNRKDRSGKVTMKTQKKAPGRKKGEPAVKFVGGRWMVENHNEGVIDVPKATVKTGVYITMGDGATYTVNQKVKSICIDSCNKCRVFVGEVVSTVEMVNCKSVTLVVQKSAPSIAVDKSQSPRIIITKEGFVNPPDIYTSNISAMNIEIPGKTDDADMIELPIPEQYVTKINKDARTISTSEVTHG